MPRSIFKTAAASLAPALIVACGGEFESGNGTSGTGGHTIIVLAVGGFGNGGSGGSGGTTIIVLAIGGFGNGGVMGVGGAFTGGSTGDASVSDGAPGGAGGSPPGTGGTPTSGGTTGTGGIVGVGGIIVLAIGGFGTALVPAK